MRIKAVAVKILREIQPLYVGVSKLYHLVNGGFRSFSPGAPQAIYDALKKTMELNPDSSGDYYEFGLYRGYTFWRAQKACHELGMNNVRFWGFDSFQGLPEVKGIDRANREFYKGQFSCSKQKVTKYLDKNGVDWTRTKLIEGFYDKVLTQELRNNFPFGPMRVAFLDCDLYFSTRDVLQWLGPLLRNGSIILFDDWFTYGDDPHLGQQKAFNEFLQLNSKFEAEPLWNFCANGKVFLLHSQKEGAVT